MNTRNYMRSFECKVSGIKELRQQPNGTESTIECTFELPEGVTYKTAANSAIYAENDPELI